MTRQEDNNTQSDLADLRGARFAITSETEEGQRFNEGKLKRITQGTGKIKAVRKYENPIEFFETHKLWIDANHKPEVRGADNAIWNRLCLIPFLVTIPTAEQDSGLRFKLQQEMPGILAWAVRGALRWHEERLGRPTAVEQAVSAWRDDSDMLQDFLTDHCEFSGEHEISASTLWNAYVNWCIRNNIKAIPVQKFVDRLKQKGVEQTRKHNGKRFWCGLRLTTSEFAPYLSND